MDINEHIERLKRLKGLLREALILLPTFEKGQETHRVDELFQDICNLVFTDDFYLYLWDEGALNQMIELFKVKSPNQTIYGERLAKLADQKNFVQHTNEFFFSIISNELPIEEVCNRLSAFTKIDESFFLKLNSMDHLKNIRSSNSSASEKIEAFIEHLIEDIGVNFGGIGKNLGQVITSIKAQETTGRVNALLVNSTSNVGMFCWKYRRSR